MLDTNSYIGLGLALIYCIEKFHGKLKKSNCKCCFCLQIESEMQSPKRQSENIHLQGKIYYNAEYLLCLCFCILDNASCCLLILRNSS